VSRQERAQLTRERKTHEADRRAWHSERERLEQQTHTGIARLVDEWPDLPDLFHILTEIHDATIPGQAHKTDTTRSKTHDYLSPSGETTKEGQSTNRARGTKGWATKQLAGLVKRLENTMDPDRIPDVRPRCGKRKCDGRGRRQPVGVRVCGFCGEPLRPKDNRP